MTLTEEQRAALKRVVAYMDDMYAIASPYHGCTEDANILRAMIDSSGTVDYDGLRCESCGKTLTEIRGSKYAGDYCMGEIRLDPGQEASRSDPPIEPSYYFWCDECKNDSSDQFNEPDELIGFDLERARGLRDFLQDDCAEVGDVWAEMIAEIERLRAALDESEQILAHKTKTATHWYEEGLKTRADLVQSKRVVEQQAARLKELEDVHKRSGVKYAKIINELRSSVYANIPGLKKQWDEILNTPANDKIGPDARPKCDHEWQAAIEERGYQTCLKCGECRDIEEHLWDEEVTVLQAMLTEAGQE